MPEAFKSLKIIPRGVANRRAALQWIKNNNLRTGVLYFGDDDNTFHLKLFSEIRDTKVVSMFPVGLIGSYAISAPIVKDGKVVAFFDSWPASREFPVDMAGFAVNLSYLVKHPNATMPYKAGHEEDEFLKSIKLTVDKIEPKASDCTEILVWHTQTIKKPASKLKIEDDVLFSDSTSLGALLRRLDAMQISFSSATSGKLNVFKVSLKRLLFSLLNSSRNQNAGFPGHEEQTDFQSTELLVKRPEPIRWISLITVVLEDLELIRLYLEIRNLRLSVTQKISPVQISAYRRE